MKSWRACTMRDSTFSEHSYLFKLDNQHWIQVTAITPHTYRIRYSSDNKFKNSVLNLYRIIDTKPTDVRITLEESERLHRLQGQSNSFQIYKRDGLLQIVDENQQVRLKLSAAPIINKDGFELNFALNDHEKLYGLGDAKPEQLQRRGSSVLIRVKNMHSYSPVPFIMSSNGWALLMNSTEDLHFDMGSEKSDNMRITGIGCEIDFYYIIGKPYEELLNRYTDLVGKPILLPIWAYGLTYLGNQPTSEQSLTDSALKFRQLDIPCDLIDIPPDWTNMNEDISIHKEWNRDRFPAISSSDKRDRRYNFIHTLRNNGFKVSLYILGFDIDITLHEEELYLQASETEELISIQPTTNFRYRNTYWYDHLRKFVDDGISAFIVSRNIMTATNSNKKWANGMSSQELHNVLPVILCKQIYRGFLEQTGKRPMIFGPLGYTGMQQFAAISTANLSDSVLENVAMLNCSLSGFVHTTSNMPEMSTPEGIHAGFLQAWSRLGRIKIPLHHPEFLSGPIKKLFQIYAKLRYRLIPYIYSTAYNAFSSGMPITRAMPLTFPNDVKCAELQQQYMLGDSLLVAVYTDTIYLPAGQWIHYWSNKVFSGEQTITVHTNHSGGPLFVRNGAIIPMWPEMDYINQKKIEQLQLHIYMYNSVKNQFTLYEDDGESLQYIDGKYCLTHVTCQKEEDFAEICIMKRTGTYTGMPSERSYELMIHTDKKPVEVTVDEQRVSERMRPGSYRNFNHWYYDRRSGTVNLYLQEPKKEQEDKHIRLNFQNDHIKNLEKHYDRMADSSLERNFDDVLIATLDSEDLETIQNVLTAWWRNGINKQNWRLHLLRGCMLLIQHTEQQGWSVNEVYGEHINHVYDMKKVSTPTQAQALLRYLVHQFQQYKNSYLNDVSIHPAIRQTLDIIQTKLANDLSLQSVAEQVGVHPFHLSRLFKQHLGQTYSDYILEQRMVLSKNLIQSGKKVYEAAALSGFHDSKYFSRVFKKYWGISPAKLRT